MKKSHAAPTEADTKQVSSPQEWKGISWAQIRRIRARARNSDKDMAAIWEAHRLFADPALKGILAEIMAKDPATHEGVERHFKCALLTACYGLPREQKLTREERKKWLGKVCKHANALAGAIDFTSLDSYLQSADFSLVFSSGPMPVRTPSSFAAFLREFSEQIEQRISPRVVGKSTKSQGAKRTFFVYTLVKFYGKCFAKPHYSDVATITNIAFPKLCMLDEKECAKIYRGASDLASRKTSKNT